MRNHRRKWRILRNAAAGLCLAVCLWCGASSVRNVASTAAKTAPLWELTLPEETATTAEDVWEDDGIVAFHEDSLPTISASPDPNRETAPVQEIVIDGGEAVENFFVRDKSSAELDLEAELEELPSVSFLRDGSVEILIYHTHTSEAYSMLDADFYYTDMLTRTDDPKQSVVAVGEALKQELEAMGFGVVHDTTVNDTLFNGSYARSWEVIQKNLEEYPDIQVTIDLHRDSMTTESGTKYKPTVTIEGRKAAQVMLLAGCDADGSWGDFPDWQQNLRLELRVQQKLSELYPELARPLDFSDCKYNMNATCGSMLIEVGTEVNTVSEARYSGQLLGKTLGSVFSELIRENS